MRILVTGVAGFIGFHVCLALLKKTNFKVYGIDNINNYYNRNLKNTRLSILKKYKENFFFKKLDITNFNKLTNDFTKNRYNIVLHFAAQVGVRYSFENPESYLKNNINGFFNLITSCRDFKINHFIFTSSSSVYGNANKDRLSEISKTDNQESLYAVTKKTNELISQNFSNNFNLRSTALRLFTVYGPYGRPDMAIYNFVDSIIKRKHIKLYNNGNNYRDYTYIDDIVEFIMKIVKKNKNKSLFNIFNLGLGQSIKTSRLVKIIEKELGIHAKINKVYSQKGDVIKTHANNSKIIKYTGYRPKNTINVGIKKFIDWYLKYHKI